MWELYDPDPDPESNLAQVVILTAIMGISIVAAALFQFL